MSKKTIMIIALSVVFVLVLGVGGVFLFGQLNNPEKTVEQFETAIKEKDAKLLQELIIPDEKEAVVDKESAKALLNYLKTNNHSYQAIKEGLHKQLEKKDYTETNQQISLVLDGKKGLAKNYKLLVKTASIQISGQLDDDSVNLNLDKSEMNLEAAEDGLYGPVLPGTYSIALTVKNDLGDFTETKDLDVWGNDVISYVVDTKNLVKQDEKTKNSIVAAVDTFNYDMSVFETNEFSLESFTNLDEDSWDMEYSQGLVSSLYTEAADYIEEIHSKYDGATLNLDDFTINYFDGKWSAEITAYVSYERKMKLIDYPGYEDISYELIREIQLVYNADEKKWLVYDFIEDERNVDDYKGWEETLQLEGSKDELKWIRSTEGNPASNI